MKRLEINKNEDILVVNIVTLNSKLENITMNLRAPIIINIKEKLGEQIILNNEEYLIKYPMFKENV
jgi:flagellar assembly factor FliW